MEQLNASHFREIALENKRNKSEEKLTAIYEACLKAAKKGNLECDFFEYIPQDVYDTLIATGFKINQNR